MNLDHSGPEVMGAVCTEESVLDKVNDLVDRFENEIRNLRKESFRDVSDISVATTRLVRIVSTFLVLRDVGKTCEIEAKKDIPLATYVPKARRAVTGAIEDYERRKSKFRERLNDEEKLEHHRKLLIISKRAYLQLSSNHTNDVITNLETYYEAVVWRAVAAEQTTHLPIQEAESNLKELNLPPDVIVERIDAELAEKHRLRGLMPNSREDEARLLKEEEEEFLRRTRRPTVTASQAEKKARAEAYGIAENIEAKAKEKQALAEKAVRKATESRLSLNRAEKQAKQDAADEEDAIREANEAAKKASESRRLKRRKSNEIDFEVMLYIDDIMPRLADVVKWAESAHDQFMQTGAIKHLIDFMKYYFILTKLPPYLLSEGQQNVFEKREEAMNRYKRMHDDKSLVEFVREFAKSELDKAYVSETDRVFRVAGLFVCMNIIKDMGGDVDEVRRMYADAKRMLDRCGKDMPLEDLMPIKFTGPYVDYRKIQEEHVANVMRAMTILRK